MAPIRLLTFSTLFPNSLQPNHGIFVQNRLRHLVASGEAVSTVVAPVPYFPFASRHLGFPFASRHLGFPFASRHLGAWAKHAAVPRLEQRHGLTIHHPRFLVIPKIGMTIAPWLLYRAMLPFVSRLIERGARFDAIDAHYFYPDGVAAVWLGRALNLPVVVTARGTDVNLIPQYKGPRRLLQQAIAGASAVVGVSSALRDVLLELGARPEKAFTLRNGVETEVFRPLPDRDAIRASLGLGLGLGRKTLISVGGLIERKGHHRTIEAMKQLPEFDLIIAGEGPEQARLQAQIGQGDLSSRVRLLGPRPHAELPALYNAADAMVLASSREGWANVLLESMACGTPVVASNIWGNPEVVRARAGGVIYDPNTPDGIAAGVRDLFADPPARAATRIYAEAFSWDETTAGQLALFRRVLSERGSNGPPKEV